MGQDQVSGGESVHYWLAAPVGMFYWNLPKFGNKVKYGNKFTNWYNMLSIEGVSVYGHVPECHNVLWDPNIDHKTSGDDFKRSPTYPCPRSLDKSRAALRIKHS